MRTLTLLAACAATAGCATPLDAPLSPSFGHAVASMQSQIVALPVSTAPPEGSGRTAADAVGRLERGERRKLESQTTSQLNVTLVPSNSE